MSMPLNYVENLKSTVHDLKLLHGSCGMLHKHLSVWNPGGAEEFIEHVMFAAIKLASGLLRDHPDTSSPDRLFKLTSGGVLLLAADGEWNTASWGTTNVFHDIISESIYLASGTEYPRITDSTAPETGFSTEELLRLRPPIPTLSEEDLHSIWCNILGIADMVPTLFFGFNTKALTSQSSDAGLTQISLTLQPVKNHEITQDTRDDALVSMWHRSPDEVLWHLMETDPLRVISSSRMAELIEQNPLRHAQIESFNARSWIDKSVTLLSPAHRVLWALDCIDRVIHFYLLKRPSNGAKMRASLAAIRAGAVAQLIPSPQPIDPEFIKQSDAAYDFFMDAQAEYTQEYNSTSDNLRSKGVTLAFWAINAVAEIHPALQAQNCLRGPLDNLDHELIWQWYRLLDYLQGNA